MVRSETDVPTPSGDLFANADDEVTLKDWYVSDYVHNLAMSLELKQDYNDVWYVFQIGTCK